MIRKLRFISLCILAAAAALALSAGSASAAYFHSEAKHTIAVQGEVSEAVFTVKAGTVKCNHFTTSHTESSATVTTVAGSTTFSQCTAFGFVNATIDSGVCALEVSADTQEVSIINCTTPLTVTAFTCWVTVGNQSGLKSVTYTNEGSGKTRQIKVNPNVTGIKYTQHSKSFPGCTNGTFTDGTFVGEGIAKGTDTSGNQVGIWRG